VVQRGSLACSASSHGPRTSSTLFSVASSSIASFDTELPVAPVQRGSLACSASSHRPLMSSTLFGVDTELLGTGTDTTGSEAGALGVVTGAEATLMLGVGFVATVTVTCAGVAGRCESPRAANAGTPNPTAAMPAVVQMSDRFMMVSP
jgi:hypothetical protein